MRHILGEEQATARFLETDGRRKAAEDAEAIAELGEMMDTLTNSNYIIAELGEIMDTLTNSNYIEDTSAYMNRGHKIITVCATEAYAQRYCNTTGLSHCNNIEIQGYKIEGSEDKVYIVLEKL